MTRVRVAAAAACAMPALACAHAFEERYDLPAPLSYFTTGAAAVVILSFVVAQVVIEHTDDTASSSRVVSAGALLPVLRIADARQIPAVRSFRLVIGERGRLNRLRQPAQCA